MHCQARQQYNNIYFYPFQLVLFSVYLPISQRSKSNGSPPVSFVGCVSWHLATRHVRLAQALHSAQFAHDNGRNRLWEKDVRHASKLHSTLTAICPLTHSSCIIFSFQFIFSEVCHCNNASSTQTHCHWKIFYTDTEFLSLFFFFFLFIVLFFHFEL